MTTRPFKRKRRLVDTNYQLRFTTWLFATVLAVVVATSVLIALGVLWVNLYQPEVGRQAAFAAAWIAVATTLLIELLLAIPIVFYLGIRQSHHVVGPTNQIKRVLDAIGRGDFSQRVTLRKGDVLTELADAINQMAETLQHRFSKPSGS